MNNFVKTVKVRMALTILLSLTILFFGSCCSTNMTDEDFLMISTDFGMQVVSEAMDLAYGKMSQKEFEKKTEPILEDCCRRYGYSVKDYKCKAKKLEKKLKRNLDNALKY